MNLNELFTKEDREILLTVVEAYNQCSQGNYSRTLNDKLCQRLLDGNLTAQDCQRLYTYTENMASLTVDILINGPATWQEGCQELNQRLVDLLCRLNHVLK